MHRETVRICAANVNIRNIFFFFRFKANSRKVKFVVSSLPSDEAFPIKFTDFQVQVL